MTGPLSFAYRNVVFARGLDDAWALFRLETTSYPGRSRAGKRELLADLAAFAYALEADFSLLRASRAWSVADYVSACELACDSRHGHAGLLRAHLDCHARRDRRGRAPARGGVPLGPARRTRAGASGRVAEGARRPAARRARARGRRARCQLGGSRSCSTRRRRSSAGSPTTSTARRPARTTCSGSSAGPSRARCASRASTSTSSRRRCSWMRPRSAAGSRTGRSRPTCCGSPTRPSPSGRGRCSSSRSRASRTRPSCASGALPEEVPFPSAQAELLFAPLEALPFPVDAALHARHVANRDAVRLVQAPDRRRGPRVRRAVRRRARGDRGRRVQAAGSARARGVPHRRGAAAAAARADLAVRLGASESELDERVEAVRREYAPVELHRPLGDQFALFCSHFPAQAAALPHYDDYLTVEQFGATVPIATHAVGSDGGPYVGHTLSGSRQPGPVRPDRGLADGTRARLPARRDARVGQDAAAAADRLPGVPAGLACVRHRPEGRPPLERLPGRGRADGGHRALGGGGLPRHARPASHRPRRDARGPGRELPAGRAARAGQARVADRGPAGRPVGRCFRRPLLRARGARARARHGRRQGRRPRARDPRRDRDRPARLCPGGRRRRASRQQAADEPADPEPDAADPGHRAFRADRGGARRPGAPAPARRLRAAHHGRRPEQARGARLRRGVGAAGRLRRPRAGRPHIAARPRAERHAAAGHPGPRRRVRARGPRRRAASASASRPMPRPSGRSACCTWTATTSACVASSRRSAAGAACSATTAGASARSRSTSSIPSCSPRSTPRRGRTSQRRRSEMAWSRRKATAARARGRRGCCGRDGAGRGGGCDRASGAAGRGESMRGRAARLSVRPRRASPRASPGTQSAQTRTAGAGRRP